MTLVCDKHYFSKIQENYELQVECTKPDSFKGADGASLQCTTCTPVNGCSVRVTCTTKSNSECLDCSDLANPKGAYRKITTKNDEATECKPCGGLDCGANKEVWFISPPTFSTALIACV